MIFVEVCTLKLLRSLITNLTSDFRNSKWRIQYGGHEISETLYMAADLLQYLYMKTDKCDNKKPSQVRDYT